MKKLILLILVLLLICSSLTLAAEITEEEWVEDLNYLEKELPVRHKDLFFQLTEEEFKSNLEKLKNDLSGLSNLEIAFRLAEIFAEIGDTHTALDNTRFKKAGFIFLIDCDIIIIVY